MITGDWDKLQGVLDGLANNFKGEMSKQVGKGVKLIETRVLSHIDKQDLDWQPLTKKYEKRKADKGLDPDILRATNRMYSNITTVQLNSFEGATGVRRGVKTIDGDDVVDIALIHEQPEKDSDDETGVIPARKLWQPTFKEVEKELPEKVIKAVIRMVK